MKKLRARYQMSGSRLSEFGVVSRSNDLLGLSRLAMLAMLPLPTAYAACTRDAIIREFRGGGVGGVVVCG